MKKLLVVLLLGAAGFAIQAGAATDSDSSPDASIATDNQSTVETMRHRRDFGSYVCTAGMGWRWGQTFRAQGDSRWEAAQRALWRCERFARGGWRDDDWRDDDWRRDRRSHRRCQILDCHRSWWGGRH